MIEKIAVLKYEFTFLTLIFFGWCASATLVTEFVHRDDAECLSMSYGLSESGSSKLLPVHFLLEDGHVKVAAVSASVQAMMHWYTEAATTTASSSSSSSSSNTTLCSDPIWALFSGLCGAVVRIYVSQEDSEWNSVVGLFMSFLKLFNQLNDTRLIDVSDEMECTLSSAVEKLVKVFVEDSYGDIKLGSIVSLVRW